MGRRLHLDLVGELGWTLAAALLAVLAGGIILLAVSLSGGNVFIDDFQQQFLPGYLDMHRALHEGSFPLLSLSTWFGGDLAGEYQFGVFSIVHLAIVYCAFQLHLGLTGTAATLILIYTAVLSSGGARLGRRLGLTVPNAMVMCLAATLNGWMFYWGVRTWLPAMTGCAWVPWAWWGLELSLDRRLASWRFLPGAICLYLLLAGGWPYAILMIGLVSAWLCLRNWRLIRGGAIWPVFAAWALGLALASPALLTLVAHHHQSERAVTQGDWTEGDQQFRVPLAAFGGAILPQMPATWNAYFTKGLRESNELFCGLAPCVALLMALARWRARFLRQHGWELGLLAVVAILSHYGTAGPFRLAFRWLPLLHLLLGLLGAFALQQWLAAEPWKPTLGLAAWRPWLGRVADWFSSLGAWACVMVALALGWALFVTSFRFDIDAGLVLFGLSAAWLLGDHFLPKHSRGRAWIPVAVTALALLVGNYRPGFSVKVWRISDSICNAGPFDRARTYRAMLTKKDIYGNCLDMRDLGEEVGRGGNTAMYAGLTFVNGYSSLDPKPYVDLLGMHHSGFTSLQEGKMLLENHLAHGRLLSQMGVDGLVLGPGFLSEVDLVRQAGWHVVAKLPLGTVFHLPGPPLPRVRSLSEIVTVGPDHREHVSESSLATATIRDTDESRLAVRCHVENPDQHHDAVITFSRAFYPGYHAYLNGTEVPVESLNGIQPAVRLAPGAKGDLRLVFWPASVQWGLVIAAVAVAIAVTFLLANAIAYGWARAAVPAAAKRSGNRAYAAKPGDLIL